MSFLRKLSGKILFFGVVYLFGIHPILKWGLDGFYMQMAFIGCVVITSILFGLIITKF